MSEAFVCDSCGEHITEGMTIQVADRLTYAGMVHLERQQKAYHLCHDCYPSPESVGILTALKRAILGEPEEEPHRLAGAEPRTQPEADNE